MKRKLLCALLLCGCLLSGCDSQGQPSAPIPTGELPALPQQEENIPAGAYMQIVGSDLFSRRDYETDFDVEKAVKIQLNGNSISAGSGVQVSGSTATVTEEGTYLISGTLNDGMLIVDAGKKDKVQLVLSGASIHSDSNAPIYIAQADKVFLTTAAGTENKLSNGGSFTSLDGNDIDAAVFSKDDLTLNGLGKLTILSPGGHGVVSKDELTVTSGAYVVSAGSHGLVGKDNVCVDGASITVVSGKDGIRSNNKEDASLGFVYIKSGVIGLDCQGDGISASAQLQIDGGSFRILCGGGSVNGREHFDMNFGGRPGRPGGREPVNTSEDISAKALKAEGNLAVNGGVFSMDCADDAVHGKVNVVISSGIFLIATGDDAVHADANVTVTGGMLQVTASYEGLEGQTVTVEGGDHSLVCKDDGLNAAGGTDQSGMGGFRPGGEQFGDDDKAHITISGGKLYIRASGDGIDSNGNLFITGGETVICGPNKGDTSVLDFNRNGSITGGIFAGTGSNMMAQTFTSSENQGVIALTVGKQTAGTQVTLADSAGNMLMDLTPAEDFSIVILSCPEMKKGESYRVTVGNLTETFDAS